MSNRRVGIALAFALCYMHYHLFTCSECTASRVFSRISHVLATSNLAQGTGEAGGARTPHYGFVGVEVASRQRLSLVR